MATSTQLKQIATILFNKIGNAKKHSRIPTLQGSGYARACTMYRLFADLQSGNIDSYLTAIKSEIDGIQKAIRTYEDPVDNTKNIIVTEESLLEELTALNDMYKIECPNINIMFGVVFGPIALSYPLPRFNAKDPLKMSEPVKLGKFRVSIKYSGISVHNAGFHVEALEPKYHCERPGVSHPHVEQNTICLGDVKPQCIRAIEDGRIIDAFILAKAVLENYGGSPYAKLETWGSPSISHECSYCECEYEEGDIRQCAGCEDWICLECWHACDNDNHEAVYCDNCAVRCNECGTNLCSQCDRPFCNSCDSITCNSHHSYCPRCDRVYCSSCLETAGDMCESCQEEKENETEAEEEKKQRSNCNQCGKFLWVNDLVDNVCATCMLEQE